MRRARLLFPLAVLAWLTTVSVHAALNPPAVVWITNSSVKLEQLTADLDWAALAQGSNVPTASLTVTNYHILGQGLGYSFEDNGKLLFLFGDTISENITNWNYHAADPLAWCTNTDGESPLVLHFYTNTPAITNASGVATNVFPVFVQPDGIKMGPDDVPNAGISLSNGVFLICNTGSDTTDTNIAPQTNDYSVLVTFFETNLVATNNANDSTYDAANFFVTNRTVSALNTNLPPTSPLQGHFINVSLRAWGTNVFMFGAGEYRSSDVFLCMIPAADFVSGAGTLFFTGLTNGQPAWSSAESNCVPVVQDNPTNGPPWPNDNPSVGNVSVIYSTNLNLWLMTYDGGRNTGHQSTNTTGVYFSCAPQPWGPWSTPQLIFNKYRDHGAGVFIYDPALNDAALAGPTVDSNTVPPLTTPGGDFAPLMIERFAKITNATLNIYYTLSTWNPYCVVKMRSQFAIEPAIGLPNHTQTNFSFSWLAPTNEIYQVDYSTNLLAGWNTLTNFIASSNGTFNFTDTGTNSGGFGTNKFYRVRTSQ